MPFNIITNCRVCISDFAVPTNGRLASSVKAANLNEMEIQALIDILLNKQLQQGGDTEEWTKVILREPNMTLTYCTVMFLEVSIPKPNGSDQGLSQDLETGCPKLAVIKILGRPNF